MDHGERGLSDLLDQCVTLASDLAVRSSTDAVLADQAQIFDDIAATCSSMGAAVSSGGATALAQGRPVLEVELGRLNEIFNAFDELMMFGDANEPIDTAPTP
jgi:hypothetical protein